MNARFRAWLIAAAAFFPRAAAVVLTQGRRGYDDYWELSAELVSQGPAALHKIFSQGMDPLTIFFFSACRVLGAQSMAAALLWQAAVGALGAVFIEKLVRVLSGDSRAALLAAGLFIIHPYLVFQAGAFTEVTLLTTLLAVGFYFVASAQGFVAGLILGFAVLTRTPVLPAVFLTGIWMGWKNRRQGLWFGLSLLLVLAPIGLVNLMHTGSALPTRGGYNLFRAHNARSTETLPAHSIDTLSEFAESVQNRDFPWAVGSQADTFFAAQAWEYIRLHPVETFLQTGRHFLYFFSPALIPWRLEDGKSRLVIEWGVYFLFSTALLVLAIKGFFHRREQFSNEAFLLLFLAVCALVYAFYWPATRFRAPLDLGLIFYAAIGMVSGCKKCR